MLNQQEIYQGWVILVLGRFLLEIGRILRQDEISFPDSGIKRTWNENDRCLGVVYIYFASNGKYEIDAHSSLMLY